MNKGTSAYIAFKVGISAPYLCQLSKGLRRPSWSTAKKLADVTETDPTLWLEGTPEEIEGAIKQFKRKKNKEAV